MNRQLPHVPEPLRRTWLLGLYPTIVGAVLADPGGAIAAYGLDPLRSGLVALGVLQVVTIVAEMRAKGWVR